MKVTAVVSSVEKDIWFTVLYTQENNTISRFQLLETYKGEEGKEYWIKRLREAGIPFEIK